MIQDPSKNAWQMYRMAVIAGMERRPFADAIGEFQFAGEDCGALRHAWREWKIARRVGDPEMRWTFGRWLRIIAIPALLGDRRAVAMPRATRPAAPWGGRRRRRTVEAKRRIVAETRAAGDLLPGGSLG